MRNNKILNMIDNSCSMKELRSKVSIYNAKYPEPNLVFSSAIGRLKYSSIIKKDQYVLKGDLKDEFLDLVQENDVNNYLYTLINNKVFEVIKESNVFLFDRFSIGKAAKEYLEFLHLSEENFNIETVDDIYKDFCGKFENIDGYHGRYFLLGKIKEDNIILLFSIKKNGENKYIALEFLKESPKDLSGDSILRFGINSIYNNDDEITNTEFLNFIEKITKEVTE